ncbi:MAG: hypothetical protein WCJ09_17970 [Planctomycetota bacterium]
MKRVVTVCLLVSVAFVATVHAEIEPKSKEQLQSGSTDIAIGTVKMIYTEETKDAQWHKTVGVIEIAVSKLEKGDKLALGDSVYARFWTQHWIGKGNPPPFGTGHHLPKKGDEVRVYLERKDGGYDALLPNGLEVITKAKGPKAKP